MTPSPILWPTLAMAALMFSVWFTLMRQRLRHIAANAPSRRDFASGEAVARYFQPVERRVKRAGRGGFFSTSGSGSSDAAAISRSSSSSLGRPAS